MFLSDAWRTASLLSVYYTSLLLTQYVLADVPVLLSWYFLQLTVCFSSNNRFLMCTVNLLTGKTTQSVFLHLSLSPFEDKNCASVDTRSAFLTAPTVTNPFITGTFSIELHTKSPVVDHCIRSKQTLKQIKILVIRVEHWDSWWSQLVVVEKLVTPTQPAATTTAYFLLIYLLAYSSRRSGISSCMAVEQPSVQPTTSDLTRQQFRQALKTSLFGWTETLL